MATRKELLRHVSLFASLDEDDLERLCSMATEVSLASGDHLFDEGEAGDAAYVIITGQLEILKAADRRELLLAVRGEHDVIGEMALLRSAPRTASVRARTASELVAVPKEALDDLLRTSPAASRALFEILLDRMQETDQRMRQTERMAQLGTMTAGVAHELNNPAAAVRRSADQLGTRAAGLWDAVRELLRTVGGETWGGALEWVARLDTSSPPASLDPLARSDLEAEVEEWLAAHDVEVPWALASPLLDAGVRTAALQELSTTVTAESLPAFLRTVAALAAVRELARQTDEAAGRLSEIVATLKSYSYLDRAPVQDVDVVRGLEDALTLLGHKARRVRVVRSYASAVPTITALGTELNQVWTNLIDNACDAMLDADVDDPTLTLRVRPNREGVLVEVIDNGPGIAPDVRERIFDAFFTTKAPGHGTGLGMQLAYRTVVLDHAGEISVASQPGETVVTVWLPTAPPGQGRDS